jgi:hypothetical protein
MRIAKYIQNSDLSLKKKELLFRSVVILTPILISSTILISLELPILFLTLSLQKVESMKEFLSKFRSAFIKTILIPLLLIVLSTWVLYGLFIYPREVHANMSMTSSADLNCLRNTVSTEYLKEKKLILDDREINGAREKYKTKSQALIDQCFNNERIDKIFKALNSNQNSSIDQIVEVQNLANGVRERIMQKLQKISQYKEFRENYCSADEYQLVYRIAYIVRNKKDFRIEDIFKEGWLEKFNTTNFASNQMEQAHFNEYFFTKIRANDRNDIEKRYEDIKGAGKSMMTGGQIVKYFAKVSRFFIVTLIFGQVYKFLDEVVELLKEADIEFLSKILNDKIKSKVGIKVVELAISVVIFVILYSLFEKFVNEVTQAHAICIVQKLNSDSGYVFGVNKKENEQLIMDHIQKNNNGENRILAFDDQNTESAISYRILLNLAISPLLDQDRKDEFYLSS